MGKDKSSINQNKNISLFDSLTPIVLLVLLLYINVNIYGDSSIDGSNQFILLIGAALAYLVGFKNNVSAEIIFENVSKNIKSIFNDYDLIIDGTDNFASRYLINDACVLLGKVLVYGAIYKFEGQVSVFNYKKGPTYRCLYPSPPRSNALPNCSQIGVLGVLPGIIGNFQALEAMKILLNIGEPLSGKVLLYNALKQSVRILKLNSEEENKMISDLNEISMITSCDGEKQNIFIKEIQPSEFSEMVSSGVELIIIDVREEWEREISKISPSVHIPLGEFSTPQIPSIFHKYSPESKIVVYCKAGIRSRTACEVLKKYSFTNLYNLSGGIDQWEKEGFEVN